MAVEGRVLAEYNPEAAKKTFEEAKSFVNYDDDRSGIALAQADCGYLNEAKETTPELTVGIFQSMLRQGFIQELNNWEGTRNRKAHIQLAAAFLRRGQFDEALPFLRLLSEKDLFKTADIEPILQAIKDPEICLAVALGQIKKGDLEAAQKICDRLMCDDAKVYALLKVAKAWAKKGNPTQVKSVLAQTKHQDAWGLARLESRWRATVGKILARIKDEGTQSTFQDARWVTHTHPERKANPNELIEVAKTLEQCLFKDKAYEVYAIVFHEISCILSTLETDFWDAKADQVMQLLKDAPTYQLQQLSWQVSKLHYQARLILLEKNCAIILPLLRIAERLIREDRFFKDDEADCFLPLKAPPLFLGPLFS